jgi:hypothetical protein
MKTIFLTTHSSEKKGVPPIPTLWVGGGKFNLNIKTAIAIFIWQMACLNPIVSFNNSLKLPFST